LTDRVTIFVVGQWHPPFLFRSPNSCSYFIERISLQKTFCFVPTTRNLCTKQPLWEASKFKKFRESSLLQKNFRIVRGFANRRGTKWVVYFSSSFFNFAMFCVHLHMRMANLEELLFDESDMVVQSSSCVAWHSY
jgi:hypothetical protein